MRWLTWTAGLSVLAAGVVLAFTGFVTAWDGDAGEDVFITRIDSAAVTVFVLVAVALLACIVALSKRWALWVVVASASAAALLSVLERRAVLSSSSEVNAYIRTEGSTAGVSNPITRAVTGPITSIDPDMIDAGWMTGAGLLTVAAALSGLNLWLLRRRGPLPGHLRYRATL